MPLVRRPEIMKAHDVQQPVRLLLAHTIGKLTGCCTLSEEFFTSLVRRPETMNAWER